MIRAVAGQELQTGDVILDGVIDRQITGWEDRLTVSGHRVALCGRWQVCVPDARMFEVIFEARPDPIPALPLTVAEKASLRRVGRA